MLALSCFAPAEVLKVRLSEGQDQADMKTDPDLRAHWAIRLVMTIMLSVLIAGPILAQTFSFSGQADQPLSPQEAFRIDVRGSHEGRIEIGWTIEPGYYLYRDYMHAETPEGVALSLETVPGGAKGRSEFWGGRGLLQQRDGGAAKGGRRGSRNLAGLSGGGNLLRSGHEHAYPASLIGGGFRHAHGPADRGSAIGRRPRSACGSR